MKFMLPVVKFCLFREKRHVLGLLFFKSFSCRFCYINFWKNMVCLNCGWKWPKASSSGDIAAEPHHDSQRDYHKHSGILFVRNSGETSSNHFIQQKFSSQEEGTKFWSGDEDETDGDDSNNYNSWNRFAGKFPILGGKSAVSQDPLLRERWKGEMSRIEACHQSVWKKMLVRWTILLLLPKVSMGPVRTKTLLGGSEGKVGIKMEKWNSYSS